MHRFCGASTNKVQSTVTAAMQVERASLGTLAPFKPYKMYTLPYAGAVWLPHLRPNFHSSKIPRTICTASSRQARAAGVALRVQS
jgi:hypothetical protein